MRGFFLISGNKISKTSKKVLDNTLSDMIRKKEVKADIPVVCLPSLRKD